MHPILIYGTEGIFSGPKFLYQQIIPEKIKEKLKSVQEIDWLIENVVVCFPEQILDKNGPEKVLSFFVCPFGRTSEESVAVRDKIARTIGNICKEYLPNNPDIECRVNPYSHFEDGFWSFNSSIEKPNLKAA